MSEIKSEISILIVDDEAVIRDSLSALLSEEGWNIYTASNAYEAVKTAFQPADSELTEQQFTENWSDTA
ncbi:TPA: hypothetical protein DEF17_04845 [bacterium]|nr:hypothetical protein [bacterium]